MTYAVGVYLADLLRADPRFEVRLSRTSPEEILGTSNATSLAERVRLANEWPADYFISIHCNANVNPAVNGTEVYVYQENTQAYWLAQHVLAGIVARVGTRDNGVRIRPSLYVLRRTQMPSILVELAYLTNASDAMTIRSGLHRAFITVCSVILTWNRIKQKTRGLLTSRSIFLNELY